MGKIGNPKHIPNQETSNTLGLKSFIYKMTNTSPKNNRDLWYVGKKERDAKRM